MAWEAASERVVLELGMEMGVRAGGVAEASRVKKAGVLGSGATGVSCSSGPGAFSGRAAGCPGSSVECDPRLLGSFCTLL